MTLEFGVPVILIVAVFPGQIVAFAGSIEIFATGKGFTVTVTGLFTVHTPIVDETV